MARGTGQEEWNQPAARPRKIVVNMHAEPKHERVPRRVVELGHEAAQGISHAKQSPPADDAPERPGRQRDVRRHATQDDDAALQQEDRDVELEHIIPTAERLDQHGREASQPLMYVGRVRVDEQRRRRARDEGMNTPMIRELQRFQVPPRPRRAVEDERTCVEINQ